MTHPGWGRCSSQYQDTLLLFSNIYISSLLGFSILSLSANVALPLVYSFHFVRLTLITILHSQSLFFFFKDFIYLFVERGEGRKKERERNINVWLPLTHHLLGTWPATQACAVTGYWTSNPLVHRLALNPLSHISQVHSSFFAVLS